MSMYLQPDFKDMLFALSDQKVEYLIVGAHAVAAHGYPRATGDFDIWIARSPKNAHRTMLALKQFGAPLFDLTEADLATPGIVFQIGVQPCRVDILTRISGVEFEDAWPSRIEADIDGDRFGVIGLEHLIQNKRATGRPKDIVAADLLEAHRNDG